MVNLTLEYVTKFCTIVVRSDPNILTGPRVSDSVVTIVQSMDQFISNILLTIYCIIKLAHSLSSIFNNK